MGLRTSWSAFWRRGGQEEQKASLAGAAISAFGVGQPVYPERNFETLAKEGYERCSIVFRCIREIATGVAAIPLLLKQGDREIESHPILDLLKRPNDRQGGASFFDALIASHLIAGNSYIEAVRTDGMPPQELWILRPDRVHVIAGQMGMPQGYEYRANGRTVRYEADPLTGRSDSIMHFLDPHPTDDWYGLPPILAAATAVDQWNAYGDYNVALMQNQCRPSGALVFRPILDRMTNTMQSPPQSLVNSARDDLMDRHSGTKNAGKPMVLSGDVSWLALGLSPADMDYIEGKLATARDICTAFGVPFVLIVTGDSTYNNRADARLELWEQTILPLADRLVDKLNSWLVPQYDAGSDLRLEMDLDEIPALELRRYAKWDRAITAFEKGVLTREEAREAMGYAPKVDGVFVSDATMAASGTGGDAGAPAAGTDATALGSSREGTAKLLGEDVEEKIGRVLSAQNERSLVAARDAARQADRKISDVVRQVQQQPPVKD